MTSQFEKTNPYADELKRTAAFIAQPGKGILASDESNATTGKRCVLLRNTYLGKLCLLFATDLGVVKYIVVSFISQQS